MDHSGMLQRTRPQGSTRNQQTQRNGWNQDGRDHNVQHKGSVAHTETDQIQRRLPIKGAKDPKKDTQGTTREPRTEDYPKGPTETTRRTKL